MLTRRTLCTGALTVMAVLPAAVTAQALTEDERFILNAMPTFVTEAQRASVLMSYREGTPTLRKAFRRVATLTPEELDALAAELDRQLGERRRLAAHDGALAGAEA